MYNNSVVLWLYTIYWKLFEALNFVKILIIGFPHLFAITLKNTIGGLQAVELSNSYHKDASLHSNCHKYS